MLRVRSIPMVLILPCLLTALFVIALPGCNDQAGGSGGSAAQSSDGIDPRLAAWPPVRPRPTTLELGEVVLYQPLTKSVRLVNNSDQDVRLRDAQSNCGCTTLDVAGLVIPANDSIELPIHFDAEPPLGNRHSTVTLLFHGWENNVKFNVTAFVVE